MTLDSAYTVRFFSEEAFARMLRASSAALSLSTFDDGRYLDVNDRFLRETGYARDEVIGRRSVELGLWAVDGDRDRIVEALLAAGWLIGIRGFTSANTVPIDAGYTLLFVSSIWLLIVAWQMKESVHAVPGYPTADSSSSTFGSLLIVSAVVYIIFGIAFVLVPGFVLALYGGMSLEPLTDHLFGAALIGFAVLNWLGRNANEGETLRAIVLANLVSATLGFLAALLQQLSGGVNALGWSSVVIYLLLALGFAYFQFMKPSVMRPSGA